MTEPASEAPDAGRIRLASEEAIAEAVAILSAGGLVAIPTETVYGLAADATNGEAVAGIFAAKGRPKFNPLILHVEGIERAETLAKFGPMERLMAEAFWPGPLTIVAPAREGNRIHPLTAAGLDTVALRCPRGVASRIIASLDRPLAAPSANPSGRISPTRAREVARLLGSRVDLIVDDGPSVAGLESTIVRVAGDRLELLRPGTVSRSELEAATGLSVVDREEGGAVTAPGQMTSHYAPVGAVRLDVEEVLPGECLIAFGPDLPRRAERARETFQLSQKGDLVEAASRLFEALARFDRPEIDAIAVAPIPEEGLGEAINDRLRRAAAPRG